MEVRSGTFGDRRVAVPLLAFVIPRVDGSWSRKRHRIFTAPRPPDCGRHRVVWQSITRATTQVYMVPRMLREGKDAAVHVKTARLGAGRM